MNLTEYPINGKIYLDLKQVRNECRQYSKGTRSMPDLIKRKGLRDTLHGIIKDGQVSITEKLSRQLGTTFAAKEEMMELFETEVKLPAAPPVIEDKDLVFFKDEDENEYHVLMRGERTRKGIFFKVKDVERCFEMKELSYTLTREHTGYYPDKHYTWFVVSSLDEVRKQHKELYLTYKGLMRVIYRSNSGVASEFQEWIDDCVFAMNWGTKEQKVKVASRALNVDADHLKAIMKKCPNKITCLYLIDILIKDGDKRVFKYGFTDDLKRRFNEHMSTYGKKIKLDKFVFIPELDLSSAETTFKQSISAHQYFGMDGKKELISLCPEGYKNVQTIFSTIMSKYCGNFSEINAMFESERKDFEAKLIINEEQCKRFMAEKQCEIYKLQIEMMELKLKLQAKS